MSDTLVVNEIFLSLQGESTWAGLPCVFVRLTGCPLRCSYCDTAYAFNEGQSMSLAAILEKVRALAGPYAAQASPMNLPLVELTGGEPLCQPAALPLLTALCDEGFTVLLETSGALDLSGVDPRVHRIMDLKCPGSGETERNRWENLDRLTPRDELKIVIATHEDYAWLKTVLVRYNLVTVCPVLVSWAEPLAESQRHPALKPMPAGQRPITRRELAERLLADALPVRFQLQMHKHIWPPEQRGV